MISIPTTVLVTGIALLRPGNNRPQGLLLGGVLLAGAIISWPLFLPIFQYGGFNVYNDTFTYLVHGQWLQTHAFSLAAKPAPFSPVYSQVALYQGLGLRMGASFFLGWVQAASPFMWSVDVYPATVALAVTAGALAIAGLGHTLCAGRRIVAWLWSLAAGTALSGFSFGAFNGFLPQSFGLAFLPAVLCATSQFRPGDRMQASVSKLVPLALLVAALGFAYSELLPFAAASLAGWYILQLALRSERRNWCVAGIGFIVLLILLWNAELFRIARALASQSHAVVGWPVPWSPVEFALHAAGLRSGSGDGDANLFGNLIAMVALSALYVGLFVLPLARFHRRLGANGAALILFLALGIGAALYFRYGTPSPWTHGKGQTWSQFKLSNWLSPVVLGCIGAGWLALARWTGHRVTVVVLIAVIAANLTANHRLTSARMTETRRLTGRSENPFQTYLDMRAAAVASKTKAPVFLDLPGADHKSRQIAAYFLQDLPVAADWSDDGYIFPWLPPGAAKQQPQDSHWWIRRAGSDEPLSSKSPGSRSGSLEFALVPEFAVSVASVTGGHGVETDPSGWWSWTPARLHVRLQVTTKLPRQVRLVFQYLAMAPPRTLEIAWGAGAAQYHETEELGTGWRKYTSPPFALKAPEIDVDLASSQAPQPIGTGDVRLASFLIKNLGVEISNTP
jgi:hypothetical protein